MKIRITEILTKEIEADSVAEAADKYAAGEIQLTAEDVVKYNIKEVRE